MAVDSCMISVRIAQFQGIFFALLKPSFNLIQRINVYLHPILK